MLWAGLMNTPLVSLKFEVVSLAPLEAWYCPSSHEYRGEVWDGAVSNLTKAVQALDE